MIWLPFGMNPLKKHGWHDMVVVRVIFSHYFLILMDRAYGWGVLPSIDGYFYLNYSLYLMERNEIYTLYTISDFYFFVNRKKRWSSCMCVCVYNIPPSEYTSWYSTSFGLIALSWKQTVNTCIFSLEMWLLSFYLHQLDLAILPWTKMKKVNI